MTHAICQMRGCHFAQIEPDPHTGWEWYCGADYKPLKDINDDTRCPVAEDCDK